MGKASRKKKKMPEESSAGEEGAKALREPAGAGSSQKSFASRPRNVIYYLAASVSLLTFLVYLKSLQNEFVNWDDPLYVIENPHIRSLNLGFLKWAFFEFYAANWHPLTWISHALDYAIWGLNPLGHHLTNNLLHAINTFLVVVLAARLLEAGLNGLNGLNGSNRRVLIAAAITGLLFGLHPVHVESAAWVAERKDLLCALFFLLSIMMYLNAVKRMEHGAERESLTPGAMRFALCFFVLALLSKPMAVTLPAVLLILDWRPLKRMRFRRSFQTAFVEKTPFFALSLISSLLTVLAQKAGQAMELMEVVPLSSRVLVAAKALIVYLWKMVWPVDLLPFYPHPKDASVFSPEYVSAVVLAIGITVACAVMVKRRGLFLSIWGYYVLTLLPVLGLMQVGGQSMADRYTYLPSVGPFLLVGVGTAWLWTMAPEAGKRGLTAKLVAAAVVLVVVSLSLLTFKQIQIWKDSVALWTHAVEREPEKASVAYKNRGVYFQDTGRLDRAIEDYTKAIDLDPSYVHAYNNRGLAFEKTGRLDRAFADYNKAIELKPAHAASYINRGLAFDKAGRLDKAVSDYDRAVALNPSDPNVYNYRGIAFDKMGRLDAAIADFDKALELNPAFPEAFKNRAASFQRMGRYGEAMADYDKAVALNPSDYRVYIAAGVSFGNLGLRDKAIECFNRALAANPRDQEAYNNRGFTYFLAKQYDRALQDFNRAIELNQNTALAYNNRGNLYLATGRKGLAVPDFRKACDLGDQGGCSAMRRAAQ